jgi:hypothetical protein
MANAPATAAPAPSAGTPNPAAASPNPAQGGKPNGSQPGPAKAGPAAAPTQSEVRKLKLKLEGQDVELPESEVIALAQQGKVSGKRFEEAAKIRQQAAEIIQFAKENPAEFFKKTGMNARQWAEEFLTNELKKEGESPVEKRAREAEEKLAAIEKEKKTAAEKRLQEQKDAQTKEWAQKYDQMFVEALGKSGLPRTAFTVKRMAELQLVNIKKGLELGPDQLAKIVREDYIAEQKALFGQAEGDQLLDMLGEDIVKKLSKAQISRLKAKSVPGRAATSNTPRPAGEKPMTWREYQLKNRRRAA